MAIHTAGIEIDPEPGRLQQAMTRPMPSSAARRQVLRGVPMSVGHQPKA